MAFSGVHSRELVLESQNALRRPLDKMRRRFSGQRLAWLIVHGAFAALLAVLVFSIQASAAEVGARPIQSLPAIRAAAEKFVRDSIQPIIGNDVENGAIKLFVTATDPDARLQLADCGTALRAFALNAAPIGARNTIGVRCAEESLGAWTLYLTVTVEVERPVLILKKSLAREAHVAAEDVDSQIRRVPGTGSAYPKSLDAVRDQHLKRGAPAGSILNADLLTRDLLVKRGQEVSLVLNVNGISIRAPGLALADGGLSDRVRVQNRTSLKVVEGTIESGNLVRVEL